MTADVADAGDRARFGVNTWLVDELYGRYVVDAA